ncbi:MAG: DNA/RNA non-specific endonuclease [Alphaproteobacteria bacterium]
MPTSTDSQQLKAYLDSITREGAIEAIADDKETVMRMTGARPVRKSDAERAHAAVQKLAGGKEISAQEAFFIEAIIIPDKRPAILIQDGDYSVTHEDWLHLNDDGASRAHILRALPAIGRIELPGHPQLPYGGTGFVVGPDLVMTNRHVAEIFTSGLGLSDLQFRPGLAAGIDFRREAGAEASRFFAVRSVAMIHPYWDMALLRVDGLDADIRPLTLSQRHPEDLLDSEIAAIGYPAFDPRNDAAVQDRVFGGIYNVKRLQPGLLRQRRLQESYRHMVDAVTHDASTLGGNSGSAVLDLAADEVVALHFAGLYRDANFAVPSFELSRDGAVVDAGVDFGRDDDLNVERPNPWAEHWDAADRRAEGLTSVSSPSPDGPAASAAQAQAAPNEASLTIPLTVTVRLGAVMATAGAALAGQSAGAAAATEAMVEPLHSEDYDARPGYDPDFLGVPAPMPTATNPGDLSTLDGGDPIIPYVHFSLVMNRHRRLAQITAANVDGNPEHREPEPGRSYTRRALNGFASNNDRERWFTDPRLPATHQLPDRFFNKDRKAFDKGHIVRRDAVAWGRSYEEVQLANGDTFHATNCSPQVRGFNQSSLGGIWGQLENHVLAEAATERLCVFAGPVLKDSDRLFQGVDDDGPIQVRIPSAYWKVIACASEGDLQVFAFKLEQDLADVAFEFQVTPVWKERQIALDALERELGSVAFDARLHRADQAGKGPAEAIRLRAGIGS